MKKLLLLLCLPYIGISQQLTTENILYDGNNREYIIYVPQNYSQSINTVELRFKTDNVITNPAVPSTMNLFSVGSHDVTLDFTRGTLGTIQINGTGSNNDEKDNPFKDTPAFANANRGIIKYATYGLIECSSLTNKE